MSCDEREMIESMNAYFASTRDFSRGMRIDRVRASPSVKNAYVVHVCGGVACAEFRADQAVDGMTDACEFNNVVFIEDETWFMCYPPRAVRR